MVFDTSIKDKNVKIEINNLVGDPFNVLQLFKVGAIGSVRMEIAAYSQLFSKIMSWDKQSVYANISLRPKGIIVVINVRLSNYSWVIPYHHLSIFKTDLLSIHSQGEFIKLVIPKDHKLKILDKILKHKSVYLTNSM